MAQARGGVKAGVGRLASGGPRSAAVATLSPVVPVAVLPCGE